MNCYQRLCTEFYDIDKPAAPPDALRFYLEYARQARGPILEPMCGSGRFLIPLLQHGFDIEGVDASGHMLDACRRRCAGLGLAPALQQQFLHELTVSRRFALAIIPAGSFQLITNPQQAVESLRRLHAALLPGGKLIFETGQRKPKQSGSWPWGGRWVTRPDGARIIISWLTRYDAATSITSSIHRYDLIQDGRLLATEFEEFDLRQYDLDEIRGLLAATEFKQVRVLKTWRDAPPDDADEDVVIECVRG
jgi:SAM-dependent methyltransferase